MFLPKISRLFTVGITTIGSVACVINGVKNTKNATYEGDPEDHYLWLAGEVKRALNGEFLIDNTFRKRADESDFR